MQATGRNSPCPCGSGKKFKRCCVDKPAVKTPKSAEPDRSFEAMIASQHGAVTACPQVEMTEIPLEFGRASYSTVAATRDRRDVAAPGLVYALLKLTREEPKAAAKIRLPVDAQPHRIRALTTEALVAELAPHVEPPGMAPKQWLEGRASSDISMTMLAFDLLPGSGPRDPGPIRLLAVLTEAWRRWLPDAFCCETLIDAIDAGDVLTRDGRNPHAGLTIWLDAWRLLDAQLPAEVRTLAHVDALFGTAGAVKSWLVQELQTVMQDHVMAHHCLARESRQVLLRLAERFAGESEDVRVGWKVGAAFCAGLVQDRDAADADLMGLLARHPEAMGRLMGAARGR